MEASRRQPGMLEGLSRFLVQHERCGAGFDVAHPAGLGSGRVSITCRGCGARHEYSTGTVELGVEPAGAVEQSQPAPPRPRREARPIPPRPARYPEADRTADRAAAAAGPGSRVPGGVPAPAAPPREPGAVTRALRGFWRSPGAAIVLVVVLAAALGFAVVRLINEGGGTEGTEPTAAPPAASAPPAATAPSATASPAPATTPTTPTPVPAAPVDEPQPSQAAPPTIIRTEHFTISRPRSWEERTSSGALLLQPRGGGRVNVQVYFQRSPELSRRELARQTFEFLRQEVPGARLFPRQIQLAGRPAHEITARGPGETAIAVDVLRGPFRYLLLRRIFAGAKPQTSDAASLVVRSFRPR